MTDLTLPGTYIEHLIPEPDSFLTLDWGVALAQTLARAMTVATYQIGSSDLDPGGEGLVSLPIRITAPPIVKVWAQFGTTWTDWEFQGTGCAPYGGGGIWISMVGTQIGLRVGYSLTSEPPLERTATTILLAHGK